MKSKKDLAIVIPNYNTKKLLTDCLNSIKKSSLGKYRTEVIVVDNASIDGSVEQVSKSFPKVKLIANKANVGFAKAVNQGWKAANAEYVLFLNSDTVVGKNDFKNLLDWTYSNNNSLGAISGKLVLRNGEIDPDCHRGFPTPWASLTFFLGLERLFPTSRIFASYRMGWKDKNSIHEIDAGAGAFLLVPTQVLKKVKGFDEGYFFYGEDIDLCYRIKQEKLKIFFFPHIKTIHYKGASSGLRKESKDIAKPSRSNLVKVTLGSINAWKRFYQKFYSKKYNPIVTALVLSGIYLKGFTRLTINLVKSFL